MPERLGKRSMRVVGVRQVLRLTRENALSEVFLALDAAPHLSQQIENAAKEAAIPLQMVATMEEMAQLCRVDVPSAAAGILRITPSDPANAGVNESAGRIQPDTSAGHNSLD